MSMHQQNILFSQINQASAWIMSVGKLSNLLKTSESLFIHRNTLIYRLNLIRNKLYKNIDDSLVRHELFLSIIAAKFLGLIS